MTANTIKPATPPYSFDGFGINGPDEYRSRLLQIPQSRINDEETQAHCVKIAHAANAYPELVAALHRMVHPAADDTDLDDARALLAKLGAE